MPVFFVRSLISQVMLAANDGDCDYDDDDVDDVDDDNCDLHIHPRYNWHIFVFVMTPLVMSLHGGSNHPSQYCCHEQKYFSLPPYLQ